ncbi:MAG: ABC transporter substrate-binding protein, partial [Acetobacteraceae bacterium]
MAVIARRDAMRLGAALAAAFAARKARAEDKVLVIGMSLPLTGELSRQALVVRAGAQFAVDEANAKGGVGGYMLRLVAYDDGSPTTGQYDPALSATNARRMLTDPATIAAVGPVNSGSAKAMCPILSQGSMALISGSATNPDLNDRKFWSAYHP